MFPGAQTHGSCALELPRGGSLRSAAPPSVPFPGQEVDGHADPAFVFASPCACCLPEPLCRGSLPAVGSGISDYPFGWLWRSPKGWLSPAGPGHPCGTGLVQLTHPNHVSCLTKGLLPGRASTSRHLSRCLVETGCAEPSWAIVPTPKGRAGQPDLVR